MTDSTQVTRDFITKLKFLKYCPVNIPRSLNSPLNVVVAHDLFVNDLPTSLPFGTNDYETILTKFNSAPENERDIWILQCKKYIMNIGDVKELFTIGIHSNLLSQWESDVSLLPSALDNKYHTS